MKTDAPNISGDYPLAGERLGPAWRAAWAELDRRRWTVGTALAAQVASSYEITEKSVMNLLGQAQRAGLLEVRKVRSPKGRMRGEYRVTSSQLTSGLA